MKSRPTQLETLSATCNPSCLRWLLYLETEEPKSKSKPKVEEEAKAKAEAVGAPTHLHRE